MCSAHVLNAQSKKTITRVLFIYDASNSMNARWESGSRHDVAKRLMSETIDSLQNKPNLELALRVYGHQKDYRKGQDCDDTKLEVGFEQNSGNKIISTLNRITPKGTTPIAMTLEKAGNDFPSCPDNNCRNVIILITDGIEECGGDPCAVSRILQKQGVVLKPFVIGVGLDESFRQTFKCVGTFFDASNENVFKNVLGIVISQALNSTTAQVNLLDVNNDATETNVAYTFYNKSTGLDEINYVHTMNNAGLPDTIFLDPSTKFDLVVHTIPKVEKKDVSLTPGTHNLIAVRSPQGTLELKPSGQILSEQPWAIVRKAGEHKTLHVQRLGTFEKYLVGAYDLEVLTLPRTKINGIHIDQSKTTTLELPPPGLVTFMRNTPGYGSIFVYEENELIWVCNLSETSRNESIKLQPGRYKVVFRPKATHDSKFSREKEFTISPGASLPVKLF